ncbi:hypothetical protein HDU67_007249 [Dinochytrium kinnereticum]|nr:hypothetical protein HDU67_007249 [Dinochytrium kinnereticum]
MTSPPATPADHDGRQHEGSSLPPTTVEWLSANSRQNDDFLNTADQIFVAQSSTTLDEGKVPTTARSASIISIVSAKMSTADLCSMNSERRRVGSADLEVRVESGDDLGAQLKMTKPEFGHRHYSHRAPNLRAAVLGANDGLVSTSALMLGFAGADDGNRKAMILSGVAGMVAGALSMACGEYVSVASQKDAEVADVKREKAEFLKGPAYETQEMNELAQIYVSRGLCPDLARQVVENLHSSAGGDLNKIVAVHLRDELAIDVNALSNPFAASVLSALTFIMGALIPLLAAWFIQEAKWRVLSIVVASSAGLVMFGAAGSVIGGASWWKGAARVLLGGWIAMAGTYGVGLLFEKVTGV